MVLSAIVFLPILWGIALDPLRTATEGGAFSDFFDLQARALMDGRLSIEPGAASIEAFVIGGREYLYFPPGLALLRVPLLAIYDDLFGRLTALSMAAAFIVLTLVTRRLLWQVRALVSRGSPLSASELTLFGSLHFAICGGSVVVFLAALPWVYHEVYMWSIACTLGGMVALMKYHQSPSLRGAGLVGGWIMAATLVRTTAGIALAMGSLLLVLVSLRTTKGRRAWRLPLALVIAGLVPLALSAAINWAKFKHPFMFPLDKQVFTSINLQRRLALNANGGDLVNLDIVPTTIANYFRLDGIRISGLFPYISFPDELPRPVFGAVLDQVYPTGSVVLFMPLLFLGGIAGLFISLRELIRRRPTATHLVIAVAIVAALPVLAYGYIAYRYTSEFMAVLAITSSVAVASVSARLPDLRQRSRRLVTLGALCLAIFGAVANSAAAVAAQRTWNPGLELQQYVRLRMRLDSLTGHPLRHLVSRAASIPQRGAIDEVKILGDCELAVFGTGDPDRPWEVLTLREWDLLISEVGKHSTTETFELLIGRIGNRYMADAPVTNVWMQARNEQFRLVLQQDQETEVGTWYPLSADGSARIEVLVSLPYRVYSFEPAPDYRKLTLPIATYDGLIHQLSVFEPVTSTSAPDAPILRASPRPTDSLCLALDEIARER